MNTRKGRQLGTARAFAPVLAVLLIGAVGLFWPIARQQPPPTFHVERIDAEGVACVAVKNGASVALSCNWPAAAPQWWQPQPEELKP